MTATGALVPSLYDESIGIPAALASAASWAICSILYKRLGEKVEAIGMNLVKSILGLLVLMTVLLMAGVQMPSLPVAGTLVASGALGIAVGDTFFFHALQRLGAHVLILLCTLGQVVTVVLAVLFLGERPTRSDWLGIALILTGVAIVLGAQGSSGDGALSPLGVAQGLAAVLSISVAVVIAKTAMASVSAIEATVIRMLGGVVGLTLWGAASGGLKAWVAPFKDPGLLRQLALAVCISSLGGFWLFHVALKHIDVSTANTLNSTEPLFVLPLAAIFLKEKVNRQAVLGAIISVSGICILSAKG